MTYTDHIEPTNLPIERESLPMPEVLGPEVRKLSLVGKGSEKILGSSKLWSYSELVWKCFVTALDGTTSV